MYSMYCYSATDNGCILFSDDDVTSASRSMGVLAGGANWGCYGHSLVPVLPQPPGGAQHPPAPPTLRPCWGLCPQMLKHFWATVYKTVHPMLSDRCPVCLSVTWYIVAKRLDGSRRNFAGGRPPPRPHCVRWEPSSSQRGTVPQFLVHVCYGQMAGWIKMPLILVRR